MSQHPNHANRDEGRSDDGASHHLDEGVPRTDANTPASIAAGEIIHILKRGKRFWTRDSRIHPRVRPALEQAIDLLVVLDAGGNTAARDAGVTRIRSEHEWLADEAVPSEEQAWALAGALQSLWLGTADTDAIDDALQRGGRAEATKKRGRKADVTEKTEPQKRAWLLGTHVERQRLAAQRRAQSALRAKYLAMAGRTMAALVVATLVAAVVASKRSYDNPSVVSMCALAGAIGGAVAGARGVRDARRLQDAAFFQTWWWVQPVAGAAVGVFVYALLESSILGLPESDNRDAAKRAMAFFAYAFVGGYSEPWLLGVMGKLGEPPAKVDASRAQGAKKAPTSTHGDEVGTDE